MPVRIGVPTITQGIGDMLQDPAYATSVGLLLWGDKNRGKSNMRGKGFTGSINNLAAQLKKLFS
jgi:cell division protein FtsA